MTARYSPAGAGHRALARLDSGPATLRDVMDALDIQTPRRARKVAMHLVDAMHRDGLIVEASSGFAITAMGEQALQMLRAGEAFVAVPPGARVFGRAA